MPDNAFIAKLSETLVSRICHDMVGPVNSLVNEIDLAEEVSEHSLQIQPSIKKSASVTSSRLRFFRLCFGQGGYSALNPKELNEVINDYLSYESIFLTWKTPPSNKDLARWCKVLLHIAFHYSQVLRRGGQIEVDLRPTISQDKPTLVFRASGDRPITANIHDHIICQRNMIPADQISTATAPSILTYCLFQKLNVQATYNPPLGFTLVVG